MHEALLEVLSEMKSLSGSQELESAVLGSSETRNQQNLMSQNALTGHEYAAELQRVQKSTLSLFLKTKHQEIMIS
jgi:hypothetical protein